MRALILSVPWFVLAIAVWFAGEPASHGAFSALCAILGTVFLIEARSCRIATETAYLTGVRHACEEVQREAKARTTPAEAQAVLDAAARAIKLTTEKP
jgi:hypothetical protein